VATTTTTTTSTTTTKGKWGKQAASVGSQAHDNINNSGNNHTHCVTAQEIAFNMINAVQTRKIFTRPHDKASFFTVACFLDQNMLSSAILKAFRRIPAFDFSQLSHMSF